MKERTLHPRRLDVMALAQAGRELAGEVDLVALERLRSTEGLAVMTPSPPATWRAAARLERGPGGAERCRLHLQGTAQVRLQCQRCLGPLDEVLVVDRRFLFAPDEDTAAAWDEDEDDDVLVLSRTLDLQELLEDELILALPLVPRHADCVAPQVRDAEPQQVAPAAEAPHPFAALAALRKPGSA